MRGQNARVNFAIDYLRFAERRIAIDTQEVILDKSFVCTAPGAQVKHVCDTYRALMTEELIFELIHDDRAKRARWFSKFPDRKNPVGLLTVGGALMRFESEYRAPATPIWNHRKIMTYSFNARLATGEFELNKPQSTAVQMWEENLREAARAFADRATVITNIFPSLKGYLPGQDRGRINEVLQSIATNMEGVRQFYQGVAPEGFPPAPIVGRTWAVFRYMQVNLLADVELFAKYGEINQPNVAKLENECADLSYLLFALLAKGLATNDTAMKARFRLLCPEGLLIEPERRSNPAKVVESSLE